MERRGFLKGGLGLWVPVAGMAVAGCFGDGGDSAVPRGAKTETEKEAHDAGLLANAVGLEQGAILAYTAAAGLPFIASNTPVISTASIFMGHHKAHRDALIAWLAELGGTPPNLDEIKTPDIPPAVLDASLSDGERTKAVLRFARKLEREAAAAYFNLATQRLLTDIARRAAMEILPIEAQHAALLDSVLGEAMDANAALFSHQG